MTEANSRIERIQQDGYQAYLAKGKITDNPYRFGNGKEDSQAWTAGYAAARTDLKKANRQKRAGQ